MTDACCTKRKRDSLNKDNVESETKSLATYLVSPQSPLPLNGSCLEHCAQVNRMLAESTGCALAWEKLFALQNCLTQIFSSIRARFSLPLSVRQLKPVKSKPKLNSDGNAQDPIGSCLKRKREKIRANSH